MRDRAGTPTEVLHGDHIGFDVLAGVAALASGCAGRDTGLMHLAAALGRPVLVVIGGGHWGQFLPLAPRSRTLTLRVQCRGCGYVCHLSRTYCVKDVPVGAARAAFDDLVAGGTGNELVEVARAETLAAEMERDTAVLGRARLARLNVPTVPVDAYERAVAELTASVVAHDAVRAERERERLRAELDRPAGAPVPRSGACCAAPRDAHFAFGASAGARFFP